MHVRPDAPQNHRGARRALRAVRGPRREQRPRCGARPTGASRPEHQPCSRGEAPGGAATRVLRGGPSVPSEGPGLTRRWSRRPFLSDAASARKPRLDRSLGLSKETPACFSLPGTKTQIVLAVPSAEGPGPPQSPEDPPRVRPGAPHTPATGASLGESGLDAAGAQTRQPEVLGQPASSLWADVAVSRNHSVSSRGTICTRKRRNLPPEPSLGAAVTCFGDRVKSLNQPLPVLPTWGPRELPETLPEAAARGPSGPSKMMRSPPAPRHCF